MEPFYFFNPIAFASSNSLPSPANRYISVSSASSRLPGAVPLALFGGRKIEPRFCWRTPPLMRLSETPMPSVEGIEAKLLCESRSASDVMRFAAISDCIPLLPCSSDGSQLASFFALVLRRPCCLGPMSSSALWLTRCLGALIARSGLCGRRTARFSLWIAKCSTFSSSFFFFLPCLYELARLIVDFCGFWSM